jgi:CMP-N,N'-diacetyllegionaminic acid synthase
LLVHLRPTTPLRDPARVDDAIAAIMAKPEATSLRSGHEAPESPFKWFRRDSEGYFQSIAPDSLGPGEANLPRQLFPKVYIPDGYVDVLKSAYGLASEDIHGPRMMGYVSPACIEVDTEADLEYLQFQLSKKTEKVLTFLKLHFQKE